MLQSILILVSDKLKMSNIALLFGDALKALQMRLLNQ